MAQNNNTKRQDGFKDMDHLDKFFFRSLNTDQSHHRQRACVCVCVCACVCIDVCACVWFVYGGKAGLASFRTARVWDVLFPLTLLVHRSARPQQ